jgi:beta-galactosidase GanA
MWSQIEPKQGVYNFTIIDTTLELCKKYKVNKNPNKKR